jgi:hypothetical protein
MERKPKFRSPGQKAKQQRSAYQKRFVQAPPGRSDRSEVLSKLLLMLGTGD